MNVAILSESEVDQAAIKILIEAVLETSIDVAEHRHRPGGFSKAFSQIDPTIKGIHYGEKADALVIVVDSDDSPVHNIGHQSENAETENCRYCRIETKIRETMRYLTPIPDRPAVSIAIAVAVPAIEAWYWWGRMNRSHNETGWIQKQAAKQTAPGYIRSLKQQVYGHEKAPASVMLRHAQECAQLIAEDLENFEQAFPNTVGPFLDSVRSWKGD